MFRGRRRHDLLEGKLDLSVGDCRCEKRQVPDCEMLFASGGLPSVRLWRRSQPCGQFRLQQDSKLAQYSGAKNSPSSDHQDWSAVIDIFNAVIEHDTAVLDPAVSSPRLGSHSENPIRVNPVVRQELNER